MCSRVFSRIIELIVRFRFSASSVGLAITSAFARDVPNGGRLPIAALLRVIRRFIVLLVGIDVLCNSNSSYQYCLYSNAEAENLANELSKSV